MNNEIVESVLVSSQYRDLNQQLCKHPLYSNIQDIDNLRVFMQHHVYAVWDFMSLIKALQSHLAPVTVPWVPPNNPRFANFINQMVLDEESDFSLTDAMTSSHASHFETYCQAMLDIGADIQPISRFIDLVSNNGLEAALNLQEIPLPARQFMTFTFDVIVKDQPHLLAAVLAFGRETLVPQLFRSLINGLNIRPGEAPGLYSYLERHIQLDGEEHGPVVTLMVEELCEGSKEKIAEVMTITEQALVARLNFWDGIDAALLV
ncbi:MAG: DUF3050 domain-containing protein [Arenicellales bacterium]